MEILLVPSECQLHWHFRSRLSSSFCQQKGNFQNRPTSHFTMKKQTNKQTGLTFQNTPAGYSDLSSQIKHDILYPNWMGIPVMLTVVVKMIMLHYGPAVSWVPLWERTHRPHHVQRTCRCGDPTTSCSYRGASDHEAPRNPGTLLNSVGPLKPGRVRCATARQTWTTGRKRAAELENPATEKQVSEGWK